MKTFLKILACILGVGIVGFAAFIGFQNKDFFKTYFNQKQQKLELRTEESVDSLLNIIKVKDSLIYELDSVNNIYWLKLDQCELDAEIKIDSIKKYYETDRTKLLNVITHQNQMIDKLNAQLGGSAYD